MGPGILRRHVFRFSVLIILYLLLSIILPLVIILLLPALILRWIVTRLAKLVRPFGLGKMLTTLSSSHGINENWSTIVISCKLQGIPDLEYIIAEFTTKILEAKDSNGTLLYPELKQTIVPWCGFLFWKDVQNFNLPIHTNSFRNHDGNDDLNSSTGTEFLRTLVNKPWEFGCKPVWEVIILPGKSDFDMIVRYHHALSDAYSMLKLLDKISNPKLIDQILQPKTCATKTKRLQNWAKTLVKIPYDVALYLEAYLRTWHTPDIFNPTCTPSLTGTSTFAQNVSSLSVSEMKKSAKARGVSFTTLVFSSLTSSIRRLILKRDGKVSGNIILHFPMPVPNHPRKLRNAGTMGWIELPIQEIDPSTRIKLIEANLSNLKNSTMPFLMTILGSLWGAQISIFLRSVINTGSKGRTVLSFTNFMFNSSPVSMFGHPLVQIYGSPLNTAGSKVVPIVMITSEDSARLAITGDSGILEEKMAHEILAEFGTSAYNVNSKLIEDNSTGRYIKIDLT
ncbi:uncharacterized protein LOC118434502 [Folsomia candida]|uniref:uncharacterized protein LOC118434502 n=1 Tax=Folsomia candida TaxID=158441 RepID=UPI0016053656|nr:uncharacterized protein LOC118434502 [Folsomia candida]